MLDNKRISAIVKGCLFKDDELEDGKPKDGIVPILVEGLTMKVGFHPDRLEEHKAEIELMLEDLPAEFHEYGGGGWTFLNLSMDKKGNQWGEQMNAQELLLLGIGIKRIQYTLPRELWQALPGSVPYLSITNKNKEERQVTFPADS